MTAIRDRPGRGQPVIATLAINNPDKLNAPGRGAIGQLQLRFRRD
jgi:hypothetical protein